MIKKIQSLEELKILVNDIKNELKPRQLILLSGPMGAGKTQFVKFFMNETPDVMSPTFAIHNTYRLEDKEVDHIDLYRIEDDGDLESTGFWDLFDKDEGLILIEWADRLPLSAYPKGWSQCRVHINLLDENTREVDVEYS